MASPPVSLNEGPYPHELQTARCMAAKYKTDVVARCVSCTRRWSGDTCRFQNIRYLFRDEKSSIKGVGFVEVESPDTSLTYPTTWNVPLTDEHILRIKSVVAASLLSPLLEERKHMTCKQIVRRTRESEVRVTCDTCMTSIFSGSWICRQCGRECCPECVERIRSLTTVGPNATDEEKVAHKKRLEEHKYMNPNFLACSGGNHSHRMSEFSPMSRFCKAELEQAITEMQALIGGGGARDEPNRDHWDENSPGSPLTPVSSRPSSRNGHHTHTIEPEIARALAFGPLLDRVGIPYHETIRYTHQEFDEAKFQTIWRAGVPVIVTGLAEKFSIQWTPQYFIETYGDQEVRVLKCQPKEKANSMERWTVGKFFESYGKYQDRDDAWKIKDWPPTADFKSTFPELFKDFSNVVPVPNYVRRDGVLNIASHFPSSAIPPDIGPKMYNAMASYENGDSQGSTRLHMDMADAVNIMTFASKCPDGSPGCAAWDLYRAEDSDKIRGFLRREFPPKTPADPIHSQEHYLNTERRQKLFDETGVKSHRIYQTPGQAVFIPAGCAHQVCNLADCIKVAVDFVSPENVHRCENLTREFREQNRAAVWKEDVLQLRTMMWFAWLSCSLQTVSRTAIASA